MCLFLCTLSNAYAPVGCFRARERLRASMARFERLFTRERCTVVTRSVYYVDVGAVWHVFRVVSGI